ncbi:MAG TPA: class I SAM-dependent methyltransferase [Steroidobacteraceae bacterium]|jgi:2-polyprenyl-3-methyl-5-hydroxy-6-metoxy-1,4-benzoquinol methylase
MRDFDKEAAAQPDKKYNYNFDSIVRSYMMREFEPHFAGGAALELGCYHGDSTVELSKHFTDLTVIEASADAIGIARPRVAPSTKFINSRIEDARLERAFSSIFMINTLEHMDDAQAILTKTKGWLSEAGKLFVLVPNADAPSRQIAVHMGIVEYNDAVTVPEWNHGHRRTYSFDTLERDIRKCGLRVSARGGIIFKALANFQFDQALEAGIINEDYIEGCYKLGTIYPSFCASIFAVARK